ncbi:MAG TPA: DinB family protein [Acidisphaera sp.]|nr:DinB family protein [Acidisphaera sp.]
MITPEYVRVMAVYNAEMNRRVYAAAARLDDAARRADRGAFWHSIHGTLSHLVWGDRVWMSRFDGWTRPDQPIRQSDTLFDAFDAMHAARLDADSAISAWAARVDAAWLAEDLVWFSGATRREQRRPKALLVTHFFNHQTHHRGQAHAMITAAGEATGDTDLPFILNFPLDNM